ncbi:hypothetical protein HS088_TW08G00534 [Tripterygium wilfordii]|uniref:Uncharacterized protein n=1 Tax=Tripterygium wilfordii TaxID=458696 RepID=A0A7J7DD00_TRIWF|nr:hypothetical protein HS088_TW08G00534 [Tripterygium wilfordii]
MTDLQKSILQTALRISCLTGLWSAMADEEPVDPKKHLEEACKPKCVKPLLEYKVRTA